ncbi:hypothetical protein QJQ45_014881, partial [Haematococcus lacustris]
MDLMDYDMTPGPTHPPVSRPWHPTPELHPTPLPPPPPRPHLFLVLDTCVLISPYGQDLLRLLQRTFAPKPATRTPTPTPTSTTNMVSGASPAPNTTLASLPTSLTSLGGLSGRVIVGVGHAADACGAAVGGCGSGLAVSVLIPRRVFRELDGLKGDEVRRGEVARGARAALLLLLEGFRQRDGFLALQSTAEHKAAAAQGGEDSPDTDTCVALCAAATAAQLAATAPPLASGLMLPPRCVAVLSNDHGVCCMAEALGVPTLRLHDLPHMARPTELEQALVTLVLSGRHPAMKPGQLAGPKPGCLMTSNTIPHAAADTPATPHPPAAATSPPSHPPPTQWPNPASARAAPHPPTPQADTQAGKVPAAVLDLG